MRTALADELSFIVEQEMWEYQEEAPQVKEVRRVGRRPVAYRTVGRPLTLGRPRSDQRARTLARRQPGVFVRGTLADANALARRLGGRVDPDTPERHGEGRMHINVDFPDGRRTHVWYGPNWPRGPFFEE